MSKPSFTLAVLPTLSGFIYIAPFNKALALGLTSITLSIGEDNEATTAQRLWVY